MKQYLPQSASLGWLLLILWPLLAACGNAATTELKPPEIHYGEDICEFCGMIISDERFAAGYITADGQERIFDDLGGMFIAHLERQEEVRAFFVHDYENPRWIRAETAYYVLSEQVATPMLHGLLASENQAQAEALAKAHQGQVLTFDQVLAHFEENPGAMPGMSGGSMEHQH